MRRYDVFITGEKKPGAYVRKITVRGKSLAAVKAAQKKANPGKLVYVFVNYDLVKPKRR